MATISFIGDIMLGRLVGKKYTDRPYSVVSDELIQQTATSDLIVANLESPVAYDATTDGDHLSFKGNPNILEQLRWIHLFSLSNNHINDCGRNGMDETIAVLEQKGFKHNGLFKTDYLPYLYEKGEDKIAIITVTDMINIPFSEDCDWDILRLGEKRVIDILEQYHNSGYCTIVFAHVGMLFTRFPNPVTRNYLHQYIDAGADIIVTAHSHCLGCMETYKGKHIFHSIGDFIMDGNSYRRRRSAILNLQITQGVLHAWELVPAETNDQLETIEPSVKIRQRMLRNFDKVSDLLSKHTSNYTTYYRYRYKLEMIRHSTSTILFLWHSRGFFGMLKMIVQRFEEVFRMFHWISKDRSNDQRDDDAIRADRKMFKQDDLF